MYKSFEHLAPAGMQDGRCCTAAASATAAAMVQALSQSDHSACALQGQLPGAWQNMQALVTLNISDCLLNGAQAAGCLPPHTADCKQLLCRATVAADGTRGSCCQPRCCCSWCTLAPPAWLEASRM